MDNAGAANARRLEKSEVCLLSSCHLATFVRDVSSPHLKLASAVYRDTGSIQHIGTITGAGLRIALVPTHELRCFMCSGTH
jgi:hypothetical protein